MAFVLRNGILAASSMEQEKISCSHLGRQTSVSCGMPQATMKCTNSVIVPDLVLVEAFMEADFLAILATICGEAAPLPPNALIMSAWQVKLTLNVWTWRSGASNDTNLGR